MPAGFYSIVVLEYSLRAKSRWNNIQGSGAKDGCIKTQSSQFCFMVSTMTITSNQVHSTPC